MAEKINYNLEALRGFAAVTVVFYHLTSNYYFFNFNLFPFVIADIDPPGHFAVLIFFMLSGLVIGLNHQEKLSGKAAILYLKKRFVRIYPIYIAAILLTVAIAGSLHFKQTLYNTVMAQNIFSDALRQNMPLWSLNFEVLYYLFFIVISYFEINSIFLLTIAIAGGLVNSFYSGPSILSSYLFGYTFWVSGLIISRLPGRQFKTKANILFATLVFVFAVNSFVKDQHFLSHIAFVLFKRPFTYPPNPWYGRIAVTLDNLVYLPFCLGIVYIFSQKTVRYEKLLLGALHVLLLYFVGRFILLGIHNPFFIVGTCYYFISVLIYYVNWTGFSNYVIKILIWLGGISYSIYVVHFPLLFLFQKVQVSSLPGYWIKVLIYITTVIVLSWFLEAKFQVLVKKFFFKTNAKKTITRN